MRLRLLDASEALRQVRWARRSPPIEIFSMSMQDPTYARIFSVLNKAINPTITGLALRLAFHDAGTWNAKTRPVGGCALAASLQTALLCCVNVATAVHPLLLMQQCSGLCTFFVGITCQLIPKTSYGRCFGREHESDRRFTKKAAHV